VALSSKNFGNKYSGWEINPNPLRIIALTISPALTISCSSIPRFLIDDIYDFDFINYSRNYS